MVSWTKWSKKEEKHLRLFYGVNRHTALTGINRPNSAIVAKARRMGLHKSSGVGRFWKQEDLDKVITEYPNRPTRAIANELGVDPIRIYNLAYRLKLTKKYGTEKEMARRRGRGFNPDVSK